MLQLVGRWQPCYVRARRHRLLPALCQHHPPYLHPHPKSHAQTHAPIPMPQELTSAIVHQLGVGPTTDIVRALGPGDTADLVK